MNEDKQVLAPEVNEKAVEQAAKRVLRIPPSVRRIIDMTDEILLNNYALIAHKASSLSSAQRTMVEKRVAYGINSKRFTMDTVTDAVNNLSNLIQEEMEKELGLDDSSAPK